MGKKKSNIGYTCRKNRNRIGCVSNSSTDPTPDTATDTANDEPSTSYVCPRQKRIRLIEDTEDDIVTVDNMDDETADSSDEIDVDDAVALSNIGTIFEQNMCQHCKAYKWKGEKPGMCCNSGKVKVQNVSEPPEELLRIYNTSATFRNNMRTYNNMFALSSFNCDEIRCTGFSPMLKISGKIYHRMGSLIPAPGENPVFAQLYFHDPEHELQNRMNTAEGQRCVDQLIVSDIQRLLHQVNPYVSQVKQARHLSEVSPDECFVKLTAKPGDKTYSLPASADLAGIQPKNHGQTREVIFQENGQFKKINELNGLYDPLHYILMFPCGDEGFDLGSKINKKQQGDSSSSMSKFYRYRLQVRDTSNTANYTLRCGKLTQQYVIDQFIKEEQDRCWFHQQRSSQEKYRAANFSVLTDSLTDDALEEPGKRIILPSSHTGSPRWYHRAYLDAMSIVRKYGKPDIFVTFTCNPDWPEIRGSLYPNEQPCDRPDIIVRVFRQKVLELIDIIKSGKVFGNIRAYVLTKEDQKRGLPRLPMRTLDRRSLFVTFLVFGEPKDAEALWERFKDILAEDIKRQRKAQQVEERDRMLALRRIQDHLRVFNFDLKNNFGIDVPDCTDMFPEETEYDVAQLRVLHQEYLAMLTEEQQMAYQPVASSVDNDEGQTFVLDAPGGCGKTVVVTTLLAKVRSEGNVALATAISGIAALLLPGGRTAHSQLKIPIELTEESCCDISPRERLADTIRACKLLVFDEFPQANRNLYEAVDRTLRDIRQDNRPFGGITGLLSGDWRQILPVVIRGTAGDVIDATLKRSILWKGVKVLKLQTNMRLNNENAEETKRFLEYQMAVGEGRIKADEEGCIPIPQDLRLPENDIESLCNFVYDDFEQNYRDISWLSTRAILCTTNEVVNEVNEVMLGRISDEEKVMFSCDEAVNTEQPEDFPIEYLNSVDPTGLPLHKLKIKVGAPVMLLRNLDARKGHCNGSRYVITAIGEHVIDCTVAFGPHIGERKFIPRIKLKSGDKFMPFTLQRLQFPLKLCFAMTTNKAQGQSVAKLGIYLKQDVFAHGQLYVALSRAKDPQLIKIVRPADDSKMINIVYPQIFRD